MWRLNKSSKINNSGILILLAEGTMPMCVLKMGTTAVGLDIDLWTEQIKMKNSQLIACGYLRAQRKGLHSSPSHRRTAQTWHKGNISDCDYQESILNLMQCLERPHRRCLLSWLEQETLYGMDQSEMRIYTADQSQLSIHLVRGDHQGQRLGPHRGVSPILVSRHYHLQQTRNYFWYNSSFKIFSLQI